MPNIYITEKDLEKLIDVTEAITSEAARRLEDELFRANIVSQQDISADIVTMNSKVRFADLETDELREVRLVYPHQHDSSNNCISVLSPIGAALLGLRAGETIHWPLSRGKNKRLLVKEVIYQPEANGDWTL